MNPTYPALPKNSSNNKGQGKEHDNKNYIWHFKCIN